MDHKKHFFTTPNPYEAKFGYHRAVRKGAHIIVSGTTAAKMEGDDITDPDGENESGVHFPKDAKKQAKLAMDRCVDAVKKLGGGRGDVVRVRMFVAVSYFLPYFLFHCSSDMGVNGIDLEFRRYWCRIGGITQVLRSTR